MIWLAATLLALCTLAPAGWALRRRIRVRGRVQASIDLHRAQLVELDRDLAERRISVADHATAVLEVQRRLLAASDMREAPGDTTGEAPGDTDERPPARWPLIAGLAVVPFVAFGLYMVAGRPNLPAQPLATRMSEADREAAATSAMIAQVQQAVATVDPHSDKAREGEKLIGDLESSRGNFAAAAAAWQKALAIKFEPLLAARVADATSRAEGRISPASADLFRRALAAAPPDAPWRGQIEQLLAQVQPE